MTTCRSVYIIGGAGTGKSTFMANLLTTLDVAMGPCEVFHRRAKTNGVMDPISGHWLGSQAGRGLYIGRMRDSFPGTDGLSRSCSPVAIEWLETQQLPAFIIGEGATLATQGFLSVLSARTELMVVHLRAHPEEVRRRLLERGSNQPESFVRATATRSANLAAKFGALDVDTTISLVWEMALDLSASWLFSE